MNKKRSKKGRELNGWEEVVGPTGNFDGGQRFTNVTGVIGKPRGRGTSGKRIGVVDND